MSSWNSVSSVTIANCFIKAGFVDIFEQPAEGFYEEMEEEED
jgi:hypothetical protein